MPGTTPEIRLGEYSPRTFRVEGASPVLVVETVFVAAMSSSSRGSAFRRWGHRRYNMKPRGVAREIDQWMIVGSCVPRRLACNFRRLVGKHVRRDAEHHTRGRVCSPEVPPRSGLMISRAGAKAHARSDLR